ncbi:MAG: MFS transporter [Euryarchaeota archaeon]|nr:MFS transporter [Euryarchaeota archaeon]
MTNSDKTSTPETEAAAPATMVTPTQNRNRSQTFKALHYRNFALLWGGMLLSNTGTWMQIIAQSLLVLQLTQNSGVALGIISFAQAAPFLVFSLVGGGMADRVDKRRLLLATQSLQIGYAFTLGILTITGLVQFWHIVVLAVLIGITLSFDQPTRFALIPSLVPRKDLSNAISLNTILFNGAAIAGPAVGGALVMVIGYAGVFFVNGLSYAAVLVALLLMKLSPVISTRSGSLFRSIRGGLTHVFHDRFLTKLLVNFGSLLFFGSTYTILLALFAVTELRATPAALGVLYTAIGFGTIVGSLGVASLGDFLRKGRLLMITSILMSLSVIAFSFLHLYWLSFGLLLVVGAAQAVASAVSITLLQLNTPRNMIGLVMSINTLVIMGIRPLGAFPIGALSAVIGVSAAIASGAAVACVISAYLFLSSKRLRSA